MRRSTGKPEENDTHLVIEKLIRERGEDYRLQDREHPIRELASKKSDNVDVGRVKGK